MSKRYKPKGSIRRDPDLILSLLSITFTPATDGTGACLLTLAGDGAIRLEVEALEAGLRDVTRPYASPGQPRAQPRLTHRDRLEAWATSR